MRPMMRLRLLCKEGMRACDKGDLENAAFQLHMALRLARSHGHPLLEAKVRNNMGLVLHLKGEHDKALQHLRLARLITERNAGRDNALFRRITGNLKAMAEQPREEAASRTRPRPERTADEAA